jgi:surfeit locus 1 family protein
VTRSAPAPSDPAGGGASFLLSRRWVVGHVLVAVIVAGCVVAGFWQLDRLHQRRTANARIEAQLARPPVPLDTLLVSSPPDADALAYRRVTATGTYDVAHETVLIGRTLDDQTGNNVLTPVVLAGGNGLLVNRGWVPYAMDRPGATAARAPAGPVEVGGVLMPPEKHSAVARGAVPRPQLAAIDLGPVQAAVPYRLLPVFLWLQSQVPTQPGRVPRMVPLPPLDEGPHLSYAVQWFAFAAIGIVGYPLLIRRELRRRRSTERAN